ncbi:hypothetical protein OROGR_008064 [Orobanche gracilis]
MTTKTSPDHKSSSSIASGSRAPTKKRYVSSKRPREESFDVSRFIPVAAYKVYSEILPQEQLTDCYYFNFASLDRVKVHIREFFSAPGIEKFVSCQEPIFPDLVRQFYANLFVDDSGTSPSLVLGSRVGGTPIKLSSELLFELFGLSLDGFSCSGRSTDEETDLSDRDIARFLDSKTVIDITDDVLENNDFGITVRLLLVALTKCLMPKVNTQHKLVGVDKLVTYHFVNEDEVDFASIVTGWMKSKGEMFRTKHYASRSRKAGLPYGSVLTVIFRHFNVDFTGETSIPISRGHEICDTTLKAMNYVETKNRGRVLFQYLREDDQVEKGTRVPTPAERVTRRGPETIRELQTGSFVRHPKTKRKVTVDEEEENDLGTRMRSLETNQIEIRDDVRVLRTDVQALETEVRSVKTLLQDFIRFSNPNFPFPTPNPDDEPTSSI